jgi:hypothetical protein
MVVQSNGWTMMIYVAWTLHFAIIPVLHNITQIWLWDVCLTLSKTDTSHVTPPREAFLRKKREVSPSFPNASLNINFTIMFIA